MAIVAANTDLNSAVRDKAIAVELAFQRLTQNSSTQSAAAITAAQTKVTALIAALTAAGASVA